MADWFAVVHPGLEEVVEAELREAGVEGKVEGGWVRFSATLAAGTALARRLRTPSRLLLLVGKGKVHTPEELAGLVKRLDWRPLLHPAAAREVTVTSTRSRLRFRSALSDRVDAALSEALKGPRRVDEGRRPRMTQQVVVRIVEDEAWLSIDAGGELLHRRGWRKDGGPATLRENLAAALLRLGGWDGREALYDPFCGTGTLPIEAALLAADRSPFVGRSFAFEEWPALATKAPFGGRAPARTAAPRDGGKAQKGEAGDDRRSPGGPIIVGSDMDAQVLLAAGANAKRAGVSPIFRNLQLEEVLPPAPLGLVVANPPYGRRLEEDRAYTIFGQVLRLRFEGWRAVFLAPDARMAGRVERDVRCLTTFSNGGIPVGVWGWGF